jgi:ATP-dependent Clp protease ATP-binding subunit ClpA
MPCRSSRTRACRGSTPVDYISHGKAKVPGPRPRPPGPARGGERRRGAVKQGNEALAAYCVDLNQKAAKAGSIR